jgi:hypothetical protein
MIADCSLQHHSTAMQPTCIFIEPMRPPARHSRRSTHVVLWSVLSAALGCGSPAAPLDHVAGCSATTIGPLAGTALNITWSGGCRVGGVVMEPVGSDGSLGAPVWHVWGESDGLGFPNNIIPSGVRYGRTPDLARVVVPPAALIHGQQYRVELRVTSIETRVWGATVAQADFTP